MIDQVDQGDKQPDVDTEPGGPRPSSFLELIQTDEFIERIVSEPSGEPLTWGATPLDRTMTESQQRMVMITLLRLTYNVPGDAPLEIADYVHSTFNKRFEKRGEANNENFTTALFLDDIEAMDDSTKEIINRALTGHASPAELLFVRAVLGIRSIELGCVTHPYGKNIEFLYELRDVTERAIRLFEGDVFEDIKDQNIKYSIKECRGDDGSEDSLQNAFLMTRKRTIGRLPDGTIIRERSSFIIRIDAESGFDQSIADAMRAVDIASNDNWQKEMQSIPGLEEAVQHLLDTDEHPKAIPVSTTIYGYNEDTAMVVEMNEYSKSKIITKTFEEEYPELARAMQESRLAQTALSESRVVGVDESGMFISTTKDSEAEGLITDPRH